MSHEKFILSGLIVLGIGKALVILKILQIIWYEFRKEECLLYSWTTPQFSSFSGNTSDRMDKFLHWNIRKFSSKKSYLVREGTPDPYPSGTS
jgi:hypothetical protein